MDNFKTNLFFSFTILVAVLLGAWAFSALDTGSEYSQKQKNQELVAENNLKEQQQVGLPKQESSTSSEIDEEEDTTKIAEKMEVKSKYQPLIDKLQELINAKITMKLKSRGTRVGTVQNFLNIYNNTSSKVDNVYSESTKKLITIFQKNEEITANGEAGPSTFTKMIEWLKNQN